MGLHGVGAHVREGVEAFLDESFQVSDGLTLGRRVAGGDPAHPERGASPTALRSGEQEPQAPVLPEQQGQHPHQEQEASSTRRTKRERKLARVDTSPSTLAISSRGVGVVEPRVEPEAVPGQIEAQGVGRSPADVGCDVGLGHTGHLGRHGHPQEQQGAPTRVDCAPPAWAVSMNARTICGVERCRATPRASKAASRATRVRRGRR